MHIRITGSNPSNYATVEAIQAILLLILGRVGQALGIGKSSFRLFNL